MITDTWLKEFLSTKKYDIIVANILAPVIISLIEKADIVSYLNSGGKLVLSGIIKEKEKDVIKVLEETGKIKNTVSKEDGEWVSIVCERN